jgi:hypothetical protein
VTFAIERVALRALARTRLKAVLDTAKSSIAPIDRAGAVDHVRLQILMFFQADLSAADLLSTDPKTGVFRTEVTSAVLTCCNHRLVTAVKESSDLALPRHGGGLPSKGDNNYSTP